MMGHYRGIIGIAGIYKTFNTCVLHLRRGSRACLFERVLKHPKMIYHHLPYSFFVPQRRVRNCLYVITTAA